MGQKVNPHGLRVGVIKDWSSRWFAGKKTFGDTLVEDFRIREYLLRKVYSTEKSSSPLKPGISDIEIERDAAAKIKIFIHTARPGLLIGQRGAEIEKIRADLEKIAGGKPVNLNIVENKQVDLTAQLVAEDIARQLEMRTSFRRAMKSCIKRTMDAGANGIKTMVSGRLGGAEIARSESYHEGTIPLHTLRADIDYGTAEAKTTYGIIGVKVWIYKGEVLKGEAGGKRAAAEKPARRPRRDDRSGDFRGERRRSEGQRQGDRPPRTQSGGAAGTRFGDRPPRAQSGDRPPRTQSGDAAAKTQSGDAAAKTQSGDVAAKTQSGDAARENGASVAKKEGE
jgi:small subunit ribosomal protein S3